VSSVIQAIDIRELNRIYGGLIYDRTQADVDHAINCMRNSIHTDQNLKGAYNFSDKNRVAAAAKYINECIRSNGRYEAGVKIKDDWNAHGIVRTADNEEVLEALRYLRALVPEASPPSVPADLDNLTYTKANTVERILYDLCGMFIRYLDIWMYCGDGFASEFDPWNWQGWDN
jgi:hypothetical protein